MYIVILLLDQVGSLKYLIPFTWVIIAKENKSWKRILTSDSVNK